MIPLAKDIKIFEGKFTLKRDFSCFFEDGVSFSLDVFYNRLPGFKPTVSEQKGDVNFLHDFSLLSEGYVLTVETESVEIRAGSESGAFYAFTTLLQLLDENFSVKCCKVSDAPRFSYRGIMLDVARHFFDKETVKQLLDNMAYYKLNVFHWHLTEDQGWRIEIKKYPSLAPNACVRGDEQLNRNGKMAGREYGRGMFFTQEDVKEIVEYATQRNITVVPEIDMPGHITSALSVFPELSCEGKPLDVAKTFGVKDTIGCVGNEKFISFTKDVLDEVCELFPSPFFHIGGDEVPKTKWKKCPKCQAFMKRNGISTENNLQGYFTNMIMEYLAAKGKMTMGWNEIIDSKNIRSDAVVQWWKGNKPLSWLKKGGKAVISKCSICYMDYPYTVTNLQKIYRLGPEILCVPKSCIDNVLGIEAPLWTEHVYDKDKFDFLMYPRLQAVAEAAWTQPKKKNFKDFERRLDKAFEDMKKQGIKYCPKEKYNPVGLCGLKQRLFVAKHIRQNSDCEVDF